MYYYRPDIARPSNARLLNTNHLLKRAGIKLEAVALTSFQNLQTFTLVDMILATCVVEHGYNRVSVSPPKASSQLPLDTSIH